MGPSDLGLGVQRIPTASGEQLRPFRHYIYKPDTSIKTRAVSPALSRPVCRSLVAGSRCGMRSSGMLQGKIVAGCPRDTVNWIRPFTRRKGDGSAR